MLPDKYKVNVRVDATHSSIVFTIIPFPSSRTKPIMLADTPFIMSGLPLANPDNNSIPAVANIGLGDTPGASASNSWYRKCFVRFDTRRLSHAFAQRHPTEFAFVTVSIVFDRNH
jgi:hypothetical protein